jgi:hypothetical protein
MPETQINPSSRGPGTPLPLSRSPADPLPGRPRLDKKNRCTPAHGPGYTYFELFGVESVSSGRGWQPAAPGFPRHSQDPLPLAGAGTRVTQSLRALGWRIVPECVAGKLERADPPEIMHSTRVIGSLRREVRCWSAMPSQPSGCVENST